MIAIQKQRALLSALKQVVSVTPEDFEKLYASTVLIVAKQQANELFVQTFMRTLATLKHRRAYMLPIGADTETCYREQDIWTYALFTAALLQNHNEFVGIESLLSSIGLEWLKSFPAIYQAWSAYLSGQAENDSPFVKIISHAESMLGNKNSPTESAEEVPEVSEEKAEIIEAPLLSIEEYFIQWLKEAMARKSIHLNEPESLVQHVAQGILLVMPGLYEAFLSSQLPMTPTTAEEFLARAVSSKLFIPPVKGNLHRYYEGDWHDRKNTEGLLIASDQLFAEEEWPPINKALQRDFL